MQEALSLLELSLMSVIEPIDNVDPETLARFDAIIDVRSPDEFAEDHIPGAINLPVLSNDERAEVGTIYKQQSTFGARRIGAGYVSRNIATHLTEFYASQQPSSRFLIYCWRGGMRSRSLATVVSEVGWRTGILVGGYKTWRRSVVHALRDANDPINVVLLDGQTGVAKSEILRRFAATGEQTLDLEMLAAHRGSVFGALAEEQQPTQKRFESLLWRELSRQNLHEPILIEAESNRIGRCEVPARLWKSMRAAPVVSIEANLNLRADYLVNAYRDIIAHESAIPDAINRLKQFHSKDTIDAWKVLAEAKNYRPLATSLMSEHYDPLYDRARKARDRKPIKTIALNGLDHEALDLAVSQIKAVFAAE